MIDSLEVYSTIAGYLQVMVKIGRVVIVRKEEQEIGWATFFILETIEQAHLIHQRPIWSTLLDSPDGHVIFIDKLVANSWNKELNSLFEREVLSIFPNLETVVFFRPSKHGPDHLIVRPFREGAHAIHLLG